MEWIKIDLHDENAIVPTKGEAVLVITTEYDTKGNRVMYVAEYNGFDSRHCQAHIFLENVEGYADKEPTHWMPLPEPPKD